MQSPELGAATGGGSLSDLNQQQREGCCLASPDRSYRLTVGNRKAQCQLRPSFLDHDLAQDKQSQKLLQAIL
ncbi:hypothetical protein L2E82_11488 [Cichorium intybus]|uniref:Uncharacterized protein n=1 Tax=Cichorium intybus TaxID=13427 RepID=A0ACB9GEJ4_CICIN|nr:hypothetical protein L2E82_11488 [Cichorium intybus]